MSEELGGHLQQQASCICPGWNSDVVALTRLLASVAMHARQVSEGTSHSRSSPSFESEPSSSGLPLQEAKSTTSFLCPAAQCLYLSFTAYLLQLEGDVLSSNEWLMSCSTMPGTVKELCTSQLEDDSGLDDADD